MLARLPFEIIRDPAAMQARCEDLRRDGLRIAVVPTMGALHGHHRFGTERIHRRRVGAEGEIDAAGPRRGEVARFVARVLGQVFAGAELRRVDEDGEDDDVGAGADVRSRRHATDVDVRQVRDAQPVVARIEPGDVHVVTSQDRRPRTWWHRGGV